MRYVQDLAFAHGPAWCVSFFDLHVGLLQHEICILLYAVEFCAQFVDPRVRFLNKDIAALPHERKLQILQRTLSSSSLQILQHLQKFLLLTDRVLTAKRRLESVLYVVVENRGRLLEVREQLEDLHENLESCPYRAETGKVGRQSLSEKAANSNVANGAKPQAITGRVNPATKLLSQRHRVDEEGGC